LFFAVAGWMVAGGLGLSEKLLNKISEIYCSDAIDRLLRWQFMVTENSDLEEEEKLAVVNAFFNKNARFVNYINHWKMEYLWVTSVEF
jgi:hypothetical protein